MRAVGVRRLLVLLVALIVFSLNGRLPNTFLTLERVSAAAPIANDDEYTAIMGQTLTIGAPGILGNDTDADGNPLTVVLGTFTGVGQNIGSLYYNSNGSFQYDPASPGIDTYKYQANDSATDSNFAFITIHVDSRPVANDDLYRTPMNTPLVIIAPGVLANDTDADNDPLTPSVVSTTTHGGLAFNSNGSFVYTPDTNYGGLDSFTYKVNDGLADSAVGTVTISVNRAPVAVPEPYFIPGNTPHTFNAAQGVLSNDSDPDGDTLTAALVTDVSHGTLSLNSDGSFTYTPNTNFIGTDSFTYQVSDGLLVSSTVTATLVVDTSPVAVGESYAMIQNTVLQVDPPGVLANDSDADGDTLTALLASQPAVGVLALNPNGSFTYTPPPDFTGRVAFHYVVNDGMFNSLAALVQIDVIAASTAQAAPVRNYHASLPIVLTWTRVSAAIGYQIEVSTSSAFSGTPVEVINIPSGTTLSATILTLPEGFYYWRMRTKLTSTTWSPWKPADSFRASG